MRCLIQKVSQFRGSDHCQNQSSLVRVATGLAVAAAALAAPRALAQATHHLKQVRVEADLPSKAYAINRYGQVIGWTAYQEGDSLLRHAIQWQGGQIEDLHDSTAITPRLILNQGWSEAFDVSDTDVIVGTGWIKYNCIDGTVVTSEAFVMRPAAATDFTSPFGGDAMTTLRGLGPWCGLRSAAVSVSNTALVVGWAEVDPSPAGTVRAFLCAPVGGRFYEDANADGMNDLMINLGSLGVADGVSSATGVNDDGWVVGYAYTAAEGGATEAYRAFVIVPEDSDNNGNPDVWVRDINADGVNELMQNLGTLGGANSWARGVNNSGVVVGESDTLDNHTHAFIWQNGAMTDLGTLGGNNSSASAVNSFGQVVGWAEDAQGVRRGFIWENGAMRDLNSMLPASLEVRVTEGRDINDSGQIVGWGVNKSDTEQNPIACVVLQGAGQSDADGSAEPDDPADAGDPDLVAGDSTGNGGAGAPGLDPLLPDTQTGDANADASAEDTTNDSPTTGACGMGIPGFLPMMSVGLLGSRRMARRRRV